MPLNQTILVMPASLAGGALGLLAYWNRRTVRHGQNRVRQLTVLLVGTAAGATALFLFGRVFGASSAAFAVTATVLVSAWVAVVHTAWQLPLLESLAQVGPREFALLRSLWAGVTLFGAVLRNTSLRHLGGAVYLRDCGRDPVAISRGIRDATAVHVWAFVFGLPWLAYWAWQQWWLSVALSLAIQALFNVYPVLHLRLTNERLNRCAAKLQRSATNTR